MTQNSVEGLREALRGANYVAEDDLCTALFLGLKLQRPIFLEGETGVGKTEIAKALAQILQSKLIRLQCYEGLDIHQAVYDWNFTRQILHIRLAEAHGERIAEKDLFGADFLLARPLLQAIQAPAEKPVVLLIDEIDRSDSEFEAFLLEALSDFQVTIPEIGTIKANRIPVVVVTSNRTREINDALKRRCIYHWVENPSFEKELEIVLLRLPEAPEELAREAVTFTQALRKQPLFKLPGLAETIDWVQALLAIGHTKLSNTAISDTLGLLLKYREDLEDIRGRSAEILSHALEDRG